MPKVDVAINYFGKPYQTMVAISSLLEHSAEHIGSIYIQAERKQPEDGILLLDLLERHDWPLKLCQAEYFFGWEPEDPHGYAQDDAYRLSARYQYALEDSDKPYVFLCHNDILFTEDLVGLLLESLEGTGLAGAGMVGQCWNCPAKAAGICDSERYDQLALDYDQAMRLYEEYPSDRPKAIEIIDSQRPIPLPECRLNEHVCLLDTSVYRRATIPGGYAPPIGSSMLMDTGIAWFRMVFWNGLRFKHVPVLEHCRHSWTNDLGGGHPALFDSEEYDAGERKAREYYEERYAPERSEG